MDRDVEVWGVLSSHPPSRPRDALSPHLQTGAPSRPHPTSSLPLANRVGVHPKTPCLCRTPLLQPQVEVETHGWASKGFCHGSRDR